MTPHPEFTVLIPARRASTRLPDKALADLGGKPMVVRVAEVAVASGAIRVVVATDDHEIQAAVQAHGHESVLTRSDHPTGTDRLAEAAMRLGLGDEQIIVNLQGDEPAMAPGLVRNVARLLADHADCAMSTAANPILNITEFLAPSVVKVILDAQGRALIFSRAPIPFPRDAFGAFPTQPPDELPDFAGCAPLRHLGIYGYRAGFLRTYPTLKPAPAEAVESLEQLRALWHGYRIAVTVTAENPAPGVDTPADLERMRAHFKDPSLHCGLTLRAPNG
jgi:3-deoxy-manno-octulosonate cytidylyltransferase (CMP-KDO synthetase)